jgi:hypothetical protein
VSPAYHDDLRYGMQLMSLGPDSRALSNRSSSYEMDGRSHDGVARRKGVSLSPGRVERAITPL